MTVTVYQTVRPADDATFEKVWAVAFPPDREQRVARARALFDAGFYQAVATVEGSDLDAAYRKTQNGVESDSWSREPPAGLTPIMPNTIVLDGGRQLGRRSSMIGDILVVEPETEGQAAEWFVVDVYGFTPMEAALVHSV